MSVTRTRLPRHQEQGRPIIETHVKRPIPGRRLGWRRRLCGWWAGRQRARLGKLDDRWDAQHERFRPPYIEDYAILSARTSLSLSLVLYTSLS